MELGPAVPTLFDACRAAGRSSAAVFGDQCLVGVTGARTADTHWPPDGVPPADADDATRTTTSTTATPSWSCSPRSTPDPISWSAS